MKKRFFKYLFTFIIGCLFTALIFVPSFNIDGICTKNYGYDLTSLNFLGAGRLLTYVCYVFFATIKLSLEALSIISILLSNVFLSIAVLDTFDIIDKDKRNSKLLFILSFLLIYNPITLELFLFDEAFIMCLGVLFGVRAIKVLNSNIKFKYFLSVLLATLCAMCYQGILCIVLPLGFLNIILQTNQKNIKLEIKNIIIEFFKLSLIYCLALLINFIILKCINIFIISSEKVGTMDIFANIIKALKLCIWTLKTLDGYVNIKLYYFILISTIIYSIGSYVISKKNTKYLFYMIINLMLSIATPFIINIAMNTNENYTSARMYMSIGFVVPIICIYSYKYFNMLNKKILKFILYIIIVCYFCFVFSNYYTISKGGLISYKMDVKYMETLKEEILNYEKETGKKLKKIYWTYDVNSNFCNNVGFCNSYSHRFFATEWSAESAIGVIDNNLSYIKMTDEDKNKYFNEKNNIDYTCYNKEQLVFDGENLYLLIF